MVKEYLMGEITLSEEIKEEIAKMYETSKMSEICEKVGVDYNKTTRELIKDAIEQKRKDKKIHRYNLGNFHVRCACNKKAQDYEIIDGKRICKNCPNHTVCVCKKVATDYDYICGEVVCKGCTEFS